MIKNFRFEISFRNYDQLDNKLSFCQSNNINKINIPCKGIIKKEFLYDVVEYIGKKYSEFDVFYHYSLYHQYSKNKEKSYLDLLNFIKRCSLYNNFQILIVSGSNKRKNFEILKVLSQLKNEMNMNVKLGIAYNPYLKNYYSNFYERDRFEEKIDTGLIKSVWLQFGTDLDLLQNEIDFLKRSISYKYKEENIKIYGSMLIPSRQFIARFKFRPWKEVYIAREYLYSLEEFNNFTKNLFCLYKDNNIIPVIETEFSKQDLFNNIYNFVNK